jgi:hypothetical protein
VDDRGDASLLLHFLATVLYSYPIWLRFPVIPRLCPILMRARPFLVTVSPFLVSLAMCSLPLDQSNVTRLFLVCSRLFYLFSATLENSTSNRATKRSPSSQLVAPLYTIPFRSSFLFSAPAYLHAPPAPNHTRIKLLKTFSTWYFRVDPSSTTGNSQASHTCALANVPSQCYSL